jgi:peptidoglycan/xylan/chitin deacetylase (PgdA/CDA1 family)
MKAAIAKVRKALRPVKRLVPRRPGPAILMYHRIASESFDPWGLAVSRDNFAGQVEWLAQRRTVLPLAEFIAAHRQQKLPADAVAITFDDGYACTMATAAPLLHRAGLQATIFLAPACLERGGEFWWDELERLVRHSEAVHIAFAGQAVELGPPSEEDTDWQPWELPRTPRQKSYLKLWSILHATPGERMDEALAELRQKLGDGMPPRQSHRLATPHELKGNGSFEFGSHGLTHASLPKLSPAEQVREIEEGRDRLAQLTGQTPATFSYPFGERNRIAARNVAAAGFIGACGSANSFVRPGTDVFALPRIGVGDWTAEVLEQRLSGR